MVVPALYRVLESIHGFVPDPTIMPAPGLWIEAFMSGANSADQSPAAGQASAAADEEGNHQ